MPPVCPNPLPEPCDFPDCSCEEQPAGFAVLDSGERVEYPSGMRRDAADGKTNWALVYDGPLLQRYAEHMTKGAGKYGAANWLLAGTVPDCAEDEYLRFRASAARHFAQWMRGDTDEDHAAAVVFNLNAAELVRDRREGVRSDGEAR